MALQHQRSTKILISRFESVTPDFTRPWESPPVMNRTIGASPSPNQITCRDRDKDKDKEKSPIRQSILNILSVFKRNTSGDKRDVPDLELESEPERQYESERELGPGPEFDRNAVETRAQGVRGKALPSIPPPSAPDRPQGVTLFDAPVPAISLTNDVPRDTTPKKRQICGVLLYLSQYPNNLGSFQGPVWLPCIATLNVEDRSFRVSWSSSSSQGEPISTHIISLARCADIRSLAPSQLDKQDTKLPLVGCKDELRIQEFKVFEISFRGREPEMFAARTVRDRARWVSAIWDIVLPSQDQRSPNDVQMKVLDRGGSAEASTPLPSATIRNFSSSSVYPPTRPTSRLCASASASTTLERCRSPSIMSLNQKSVVKQRLAQIKNMGLHSVSSASSRTVSNEGYLSYRRWDRNTPPTDFGAVTDQETISPNSGPGVIRSIPDESHVPLNIEALLGHLQNHAHEHREQVTHLEDHLIGLQDEIQRLPKELSFIVGNLRTDNTSDIQQMVTKVERKIETTADVLGAIEDKLSILADGSQKQASAESIRAKSAPDLLRAMEGINAQIESDFPTVLARLAQIQQAQERNEKTKHEWPPRNRDLPLVDLSTVLSKLDAVIALQRKVTTPLGKGGRKANCTDVSSKDIKDDLAKVFSLLEDNNQQRALHTQQQADSVRYLTELNTWLEAFVNYGTSQIESVAVNVEQLRKILGCSEQGSSSVDGTGQTNLLQDLRGLVSNAQAQQQGSDELQKSINGLLAILNNSRLPELGSIAGVVEQYRQDQVDLLKTIKRELSSEIKGERIRFVEAMKEATSINVQMHVENLKQTLAAEVLKMSNDIGRLHQEKQVLEGQIQEMLAFQDKQKLFNNASGEAGNRRYQTYLEEYPTVTGQGHMSFSVC